MWSLEEIRKMGYDSIFANKPHHTVSNSYNFIPTIEVAKHLENDGWNISKIQETKSRTKHGFQKHMIRFRPIDKNRLMIGDDQIEIVLINAHDRSSPLILEVGIIRFSCANGVITSSASVGSLNVKHNTHTINGSGIEDAIYSIIDEAPNVVEPVNEMKKIELSPNQKIMFAEEAVRIKYGKTNSTPLGPSQVLEVRRPEDTGNDLWSVFNVVQENLLTGGIGIGRTNKRRSSTRRITSIDKEVDINKKLWDLSVQCIDNFSF